jgi:hypothetical protein
MGAKPARIDSASSGSAELDRLEAIRLDQDWSYRELAADMRRARIVVSDKTLQSLLRYRPKRPYDRTLHKIRKYLAAFAELHPPQTTTSSSKRRVHA